MFPKLIPVLFLSLIFSSSVVRSLPNPVSSLSASRRGSRSGSVLLGLQNNAKSNNNKTQTNNKDVTNNNGTDPQTSQCLDPSVLNEASKFDGLQGAEPNTTAAITSGNNFINFCAQSGLAITNGTQNPAGSCNPIPMGQIPAKVKMPTVKILQPQNLGSVKANSNFTVQVAVKNMVLGDFSNAESTYYNNPQLLDDQGLIKGHTHFVCQQMDSFTSTQPFDTANFAFFKGINTQLDSDGTVSILASLPEGTHRCSTLTSTSTHAMVQMPVAQRGAVDDTIFIAATADGSNSSNTTSTTTDGSKKSNSTTSALTKGQTKIKDNNKGNSTSGSTKIDGNKKDNSSNTDSQKTNSTGTDQKTSVNTKDQSQNSTTTTDGTSHSGNKKSGGKVTSDNSQPSCDV